VNFERTSQDIPGSVGIHVRNTLAFDAVPDTCAVGCLVQSVLHMQIGRMPAGNSKHAINELALNRTCNLTLLQPQHSYRVNPQRKSEVIMRQLHHFHGRFESVISLRANLIEESKEQVPTNSVTSNVGYFEG